MSDNRFASTSTYVASQELLDAVNVAMVLEKPLLIKGEPGTGKTMLAAAVAESLGKETDHMEHQVHHQGSGRTVYV